MISQYTVVRYLPHPLSGERINVGLIAWGEGRIAARFVDDWRPVRAFGKEDVRFLREFAERVEAAASAAPELPGLVVEGRLDQALLEKIVGTWINSIQFSEPKGSLKLPEEVLNEVGPIFLRAPQPRREKPRDRRIAAALAAQTVFSVLRVRVGKQAEQLVKRHHPVRGKLDQHDFDVVVSNGVPFLAAQGLSFEVSESGNLQKEIDSTAWAIDDVKEARPRLPLAILVLPPKGKSRIYDRATRVFRGLEAEVVNERQMDVWVRDSAKKIPVKKGHSA